MVQGGILILDFGSQVTQLIARRLRELGVYSEIVSFDLSVEKIREYAPAGIILSGGPRSVDQAGSPRRSLKPLMEIAPLLGICYGMQLLAQDLGGEVKGAKEREYGLTTVIWKKPMGRIPTQQKVWMSHGDVVVRAPQGFEVVASSESGHPAALIGPRAWAVQFHPEVSHTEMGNEILRAFVFELCLAEPRWTSRNIVEHLVSELRHKAAAGEVICALSGGVDSTVMGVLLTRAIGPERVHCIFVNNGLLRMDEYQSVLASYKTLGLNVEGIDAEHEFLERLKDIEDPEEKRKRIGHLFIEIFERAGKRFNNLQWLAQGTLYPDVIESISLRGESVTIKSHHNVGGLPEKMHLKLLEPLRELFKDEVRAIGRELGLPDEVLFRHPFPGPGLAIRIIGAVNGPDLQILRECDRIWVSALKEEGFYPKIWQAFAVLLPIKTVGVQGDGRTYEKVVALRAVTSQDAMTADWFEFPASFLRKVSNEITNRVRGVNRVVYDITSKPPGTIEWE